MTSEIRVYDHPTFGSIRMFEEDGEIITVADDFAKMLGYEQAAFMTRSLDEDEKGLRTVQTPGGPQRMSVITEAGMYHAILMRRSACVKDPEAREVVAGVRRWVTHEVLPSIRKTGGYVNPQALPQVGTEEGRELMAQAVIYAQQTLAALQAENDAMRPKAELGEAVSAAANCIEVRELGHLLCQNGLPGMGLKNTFKLLREGGYVFRNSDGVNVPYQRWINEGLFQVQEVPYTRNGVTYVGLKTMVTPKGVEYLLRKYAPDMALKGLEGAVAE